jgi:hypothetical protein
MRGEIHDSPKTSIERGKEWQHADAAQWDSTTFQDHERIAQATKRQSKQLGLILLRLFTQCSDASR